MKFRQQTGRQLSRQVPPNSDDTDGICSYACHAARYAVLVQTTQFKRSHKNVTRTQKELHTEQNAIVGRKPLTLICRLRTLKPAECYSLASRGSAISANPEEDTSSKTCSPLRTDSTFSMRLVNSTVGLLIERNLGAKICNQMILIANSVSLSSRFR